MCELSELCSRPRYDASWSVVMCSGPVASHFCTSFRPLLVCFSRSGKPLAIWVPTRVTRPTTMATTSSTVSRAATPRGIPPRVSTSVTGRVRATSSIAMRNGTTMTSNMPSTRSSR